MINSAYPKTDCLGSESSRLSFDRVTFTAGFGQSELQIKGRGL